MSVPSDGDDVLHELKAEVEAEVMRAEAGRPEDVSSLPVTDWLFDPTDVEREEIGLRGLLGAIKALEDAPRPGGDGRTV
ncbi:hypothetical protein [Streptosporangium pseudovulgare]|uniref:Uncharacterized protein n=1 Tax=Streptosporangium pseudovulgare TaxID=35765 RepID=A0ABQ2RGR7_9ACTN|nr:hypothetical protein [Streptosporangium pseudovulgare]GGQ30222.1 hypothetical protein GCM10010140_70490 [Streptosporangium pseudovulgare]